MKSTLFALIIALFLSSFCQPVAIASEPSIAQGAPGKPVNPIRLIRRETGAEEIEDVMGNAAIKFAYHTKLGLFITRKILVKRWPSKLMGFSKNTKRSAKKIPDFVDHYKIKMNEFQVKDFRTFNEFFIREYKDGVRPFDYNPEIFSAGAEGRYLALENISLNSVFPVKGIQVYLPELFGSAEIAEEFVGGTILIARLAPVDYHRFHFPVDSTILSTQRIHGNYDSVNPIALAVKPDILFKNERQISILENAEMGRFAMIEVGAFAVGKIIQSAYPADATFPLSFIKGQEKGYFQFGASTVIWVFKKNQIKVDEDLLQNSAKGLETIINLGDHLGTLQKPSSKE